MNRPQRNNSPINLRYAHQTEATGQDADGFAIFPNAPAGWRAAVAQIKLDQSRGISLEQFIHKFAPPNENDTEAYLRFVEAQLGRDGSILLSEISPYVLAGVMSLREGWFEQD